MIKKIIKRTVFLSQNYALRFLFKFLSLFSLKSLYLLAGWAAFFLEKSNARIFRVIQIHLNRLADVSALEMTELNARAVLQETCKAGVEMLYFWTCSYSALKARVSKIHGLDDFNAAKNQGQGVLLLGPHLGSWELINLYFSPLSALYDPLRFEPMNEIMKSGRERFGSHLFPANPMGVKKIFKALLKGDVVGILPDQVPDSEESGLFVPFLGADALTISLPVKLVQKKRVPVFYTFAERQPHGFFEIYFIPVHPDFYSEDMSIALTAMNKGIEACIAMCPLQYQFGYKRFKRRPLGQESWY
jgi:KDO2-lipid IV(A) lauroyltransferase